MTSYRTTRIHRREIDRLTPSLEVVMERAGYAHLNLSEIPIIFVVRYKKEIVAFAGLACYHGKWCFRGCVVVPEHRGHGLQRRLLRTRTLYLKRRNVKSANVWVDPHNVTSMSNVIIAGFLPVIPLQTKSFHGVKHIKLRKAII